MKLDCRTIPSEHIDHAFGRLKAIMQSEKVTFVDTHTEMMTLAGYMKGGSELPHVLADNGVVYFPNVFLARLAFLKANKDIDGDTMHWAAKSEQTLIDGFTFFRFVRTVH